MSETHTKVTKETKRACHVCGCTDERACIGNDQQPCYWTAQDLCSCCTPRQGARLSRASWIDLHGGLHLVASEALAEMGVADTPENREEFINLAEEVFRQELPEARVMVLP